MKVVLERLGPGGPWKLPLRAPKTVFHAAGQGGAVSTRARIPSGERAWCLSLRVVQGSEWAQRCL